MATTSPSAALMPVAPMFSNTERLALAGFLAGYSGLTRDAYELDLRQFVSWCHQHHLRLFSVRRSDIECFARDLEARGRARATVTRRLCTVAGLYLYAVEEELLDHSPAIHVRRPRLDYESHATALDRNEMGALLVAAGPGPVTEHPLISLLALNGLRVSEATGADTRWKLSAAPRCRSQLRNGPGSPASFTTWSPTTSASWWSWRTAPRTRCRLTLTVSGRRLPRSPAPAGRYWRRCGARCGGLEILDAQRYQPVSW
jgi:Phage integrase, N-terminal SAM-like domain